MSTKQRRLRRSGALDGVTGRAFNCVDHLEGHQRLVSVRLRV